VELINDDPHFVTTSTCSGRISVFASSAAPTTTAPLSGSEGTGTGGGGESRGGSSGHGKGGGGRWLLSSHAPVSPGTVQAALARVGAGEDAVLKHEPAIMHVRCVDMAWVSRADNPPLKTRVTIHWSARHPVLYPSCSCQSMLLSLSR